MVNLGKINSLAVVGKARPGVLLDGGELGEILLPRRYAPANCQVGDRLNVFVFPDSEQRVRATTLKPYAMVGETAWLRVVSADKFGAFLDWGLPTYLTAPAGEQKRRMTVGHSYLVYVYIDDTTGRVAASSKLGKFLGKQPVTLKRGQRVGLLIDGETRMGYKAVVDDRWWGLLYRNEVFQTLRSGQRIKGYVKQVREGGKIDLSLQKLGYDKVSSVSENIFKALQANNGFLAVTDKTPSERIQELFGVSKKTYKKAVGALYKARKIKLEKEGIALAQKHR